MTYFREGRYPVDAPSFFSSFPGFTVQIIETGINPARTKDYQVRELDNGTLELWLYKRGKLWAKKYYTKQGADFIPSIVEKFFEGKLYYHPLNMRGLGTEPK